MFALVHFARLLYLFLCVVWNDTEKREQEDDDAFDDAEKWQAFFPFKVSSIAAAFVMNKALAPIKVPVAALLTPYTHR